MRWVFVASSAYLGRIEGETRCAFWADEPIDHDFDPTKLISVDLAMTPSAAVAGEISWDAVQVEDCISGPNGSIVGTTLGPRWPELNVMGAIYLEQRFWSRLPDALRPPCPPQDMGTRAHEYTTVVYWPHIDDPRAGRRYVGHHARVVEQRGSLARLELYPPGSSERPTAKPSLMWVDLESPEQCDAGKDSLTQIGGDVRELIDPWTTTFTTARSLP